MADRITRKRKKPTRLGESDENMDDLFDQIDRRESTKSDDKDEDYANLSRTSSEVSISGSIETATLEKNGYQKSTERQLARIEAKLDEMHKVLIQIQRASISGATTSLMESENIPELPLTSVESLDKFEQDLSDEAYRKKIVSNSL